MSLLVLLLAAGLIGICGARRLYLGVSVAGLTISLLLGCAATALITLILGLQSLNTAQVGIYVVTLAAAAVVFGRRRPPRLEHLPRVALVRLTPLEGVAMIAIACSLALAFVRTGVPVTDWDAVTTHLALPAAYAHAGRIAPVAMPAGLLPHAAHTLYTWAFYIGGERSAAQLAWFFALLATGGVYAAANEMAGRRAGLAAAALLATSPFFHYAAAVPGTSLLLTACAGAAVAALLAWQRTGERGWRHAAALVTGLACGVAYGGCLLAVLLVVWIAWRRAGRRTVAGFAALAMAAALPWLLHSATAAVSSGVSPAALLLPHSPFHHVQPPYAVDLPGASDNGTGAFVMYFWNLLMRPVRVGGWWLTPGGLLPWVGLVAFVAGTPKARPWCVAAVAALTVLFFLDRRPPSLFPWFGLAMSAIAAGAVTLPRLRRTAAVLLGAAFVHGTAAGILVTAAAAPVLAGTLPRSQYLEEQIPAMAAFEWINANSGGLGAVLSLDPRVYYLRQPAVTDFHGLARLATRPVAEQMAWLQEKGVAWILLSPGFAAQQPCLERSGINGMVAGWKRAGGQISTVMTFFPKDTGGTAPVYLEILRVY